MPYGTILNAGQFSLSSEETPTASMDINAPTSTEMLLKDIGITRLDGAKDLNATISSLIQEELIRIRDILGDSTVTESNMQFAVRWFFLQSYCQIKSQINRERSVTGVLY